MKMVSLPGAAGEDVSNEAYPASFNTGGSVAYCGNFSQICLQSTSPSLEHTNTVISMKTLIIKSLLTSLC
jgi:hypothetical protein